ncbi:nitrate reductase cytochrome c-type subunit [Bacillus marasmi]|uniref:nitrate reductase cytochrome c-type subunit n=1 Tax=Bacillus marasmi TaxID=1926279 RepID=UPI0011C9C503|nr:nitrate reductase cytochrome c-type subunit [Bacillus marasmi]
MNRKTLYSIFAIVVVVALGVAAYTLSGKIKEETSVELALLPQLQENGRPDATTMELQEAPPMQHISHKDRWVPEKHHESCLMCHGKQGTGAPTPPENHFYDNDVKGLIYRDNCIQCHAEQQDVKTKTAFKEKK